MEGVEWANHVGSRRAGGYERRNMQKELKLRVIWGILGKPNTVGAS